MAARHGIENEIPTYARGKRRIDYVFATPGVYGCIRNCGVLAYDVAIISDHRGIFCDIDLVALLGSTASKMASLQQRLLNSARPADVYIYQTALMTYVIEHRIEERVYAVVARIEQEGLTDELSYS